MTDTQKLEIVKTLLEDGGDVPSDSKLTTYIDIAGNEILAWIYHLVGGVPEDVTVVPSKYENVQVYAVIAGYTHAGSEGQDRHVENGVQRNFKYADMLDYIHNNVLPYGRVGAVS